MVLRCACICIREEGGGIRKGDGKVGIIQNLSLSSPIFGNNCMSA